MQKEELIKFETEIAELFNLGKIRAPVHLYHGNEEQIINIFKNIKKDDWVFCSWRSHYQCLLKGVPKTDIKNEVIKINKSRPKIGSSVCLVSNAFGLGINITCGVVSMNKISGIGFNDNEDFIQNWLRSPQTSLYYSLQVMQNTQDKSDALAALDGNFGEMFGFDDIDPDDNDIVNVFNDPAACVGCAE